MIFCVEDDANIRNMVVYTLQASGFEATGLADGAALSACGIEICIQAKNLCRCGRGSFFGCISYLPVRIALAFCNSISRSNLGRL